MVMAFTKKYLNELFVTVVVLSAVLSTASAVDCHGKSFHCVNSTHFMICVDLGGGVSQAIDNFYIACPPPTVCNGANHFECEFPAPTTPAPSTASNVISDTTLPWVEIVTTSSVGNTTKEFSENYMNTERTITVAEFSITTDTTVGVSAKTVPDIYINNELNITEIVPTTALETATTQIDYIQPSISEDRNITETQPTIDTMVAGSAKTAPDIYINNELNVTKIVPTTAVETANTQIDYIPKSVSEDPNITEIQSTTEDVTTAIVENVRQNTSETWNSNQTKSVIATTIENLVITETVTEPAPVVTDQITQTTTSLLLETAYLNTELPQVITLTQNENGTSNYGTNIDLAPILDEVDVTEPTGISNNISPAETTPLSDMIAKSTTDITDHLATMSADIISTDVYHSSTSAPFLENEKNKSSSANVSVISNLNSVDEGGLLEKKTTQTITINDAVGETTTTFDAWVVISGNENPTTVSNSIIFPDVTESSIYLQTQTDVMDTKVTDKKNVDVLPNTQNPQDATTLAESLNTEEIQNNPNLEQPTTAKIGINSIKDSAQRVNLDMITTEAGINIPTTFSTIQEMEAQSNRKIDIPTSAKKNENFGSTDKLNPINKLSIYSNINLVKENITTATSEVNQNSMSTGPSHESTTSIDVQSLITKDPVLVTEKPNLANTELDGALKMETVEMARTEQPTTINKDSGTRDTSQNIETGKNIISTEETIIALNTEVAVTEQPMQINEDSLTAITIVPNVATGNNEFYASDAVYYEPSTSNDAESWITKAPLLATKTPKFSDTKLDGGKLDDRSVATEESNILSSQIAGLDRKLNTTLSTPTEVINSTRPVTIEVSDLKTNSQNSIDTKQDEMRISQTVQLDAITEKPTKSENTFTNTIPIDAKETRIIPTREVVNPDIVLTDAAYTPAISNNDQPMITEASILLTTEPNFVDTKIDGGLPIEPAGIANTGSSTKANGETKTTDAIKKGATDNTKNQSNQLDLDTRVINAAYAPTERTVTHNPTDTKQDDTTNTQTVEISGITEQPTETNDENLTMVTAQNVVIEKIGMPTGESVNPDIVPTDAAYTPAISNSNQPMITEASILLTTEPNFVDTKIDGGLLIEPAGIANTGSSTKANGETKTTDAIKNGATDNTKNQSNQLDLDTRVINAAYAPTVRTVTHNPTDTKQDDTTNTQTVKISGITEQPTETNDENWTMVTAQNVVIEKIGMPTGESVNPDIVPTDAAYTPAISNSNQPIIPEASVLLTTESNFADTKIDGVLLIEPAGIANTGPSTKASGETKTTDAIKNGASDKTINQSNQANLDNKVFNAVYTPTLSDSTHNLTDTKQDHTTKTQTVDISAITDQPTETNDENLTMITTQNFAIEKIGMQTGEAVNPDIISTEPVYEATTDINANLMTTAAPTLVIKKPYLAETKLDEELLIEPVVIASTEQPKMVNEESKKSAQTNKPSHFITLAENPSKTEQDGTTVTQINTDTITEPTKKNEESTTTTINQNIAKEKTIIAASEVDAPTPITITNSLLVPGIVSEDNMQTTQLSKQVPTSTLRTNEPLYSEAVGNNYDTQESFIIKEEGIATGLNEIPTEVEAMPIANNNAQSGFQDTTQSFDETPVGWLPDKTTHTSFQEELASNALLETAVDQTTNTYVLPPRDKSATEVSTITNNDPNTMNLTSRNAQNNKKYQTIISGSNDGTKLNEVNSKFNYTNVEKNNPTNVDNRETTIATIIKGVGEGNTNVNKIHDAISKLDVTSEKSIPETLASLHNTDHGFFEQNDSSFVLSGSLSTKEETNGIVNQTVMKQKTKSETTPITKHVADRTMKLSTVERNDEADKINKNPLDNYLIDQSNQDENYLNKYSVTNVKDTYSPNNNFDNSKQKDATILLSESSTPKDETIGIANVISQLGAGDTTPVINSVPYSSTQSSTVESNAQASNIYSNPLDNYLINQTNQEKKNQNNYDVTNVTEINIQNNNFVHSKQKDGTIGLRESSTPNEESNGFVNQNVVGQLGEGEKILVIDNVPYRTTLSSTIESNDQASNINWNPLDKYLIDQPNQNSESLSKSYVTNTKMDGNDVNAVSLDPKTNSQQPPTTSMTADRPGYVNPIDFEQNKNIATQERNGQLENTTDVKSLPEAENVSVAVTNMMGTKDNFNLKSDGLAVSGFDVLSATTAVITEKTVAENTQDSIQNTPQIIANLFNQPLVSTVEEFGTSVKKSESNTEYSPNINENIDTSNKDTPNIALSKNSDTLTRTLTSRVIEDGKVYSSTVESKKLPSQSVTKLTHGYSEMTTPTPNVNHVDEVDKASKPMLDVLPLPINNFKLSTSVTDKSLLTDSTSEGQTKYTIIITESYTSTTLSPTYSNSRAQPGDNVGVVNTARTIVNPTSNIQTQVKAQPIANTKDLAGHGSVVDNSQSAVIATTASIIEGANLRPPTGRTDYSLQHPQQTEQGFSERTNTPSASHIITRTEASITETNNDNPNKIISFGDVHIGIASQSVPEANNKVTDTARNNAKTVTQQNNSSTNLTSSLYTTQKMDTPSVTHNPMPNVTNNINKQVSKDATMPFSCISGVRGRYSDRDDCRKFYICIGNNQPIVGNCPENTVFSDIKKLCTKNLSHCIRDNEFKCPSAGRFSDFVKDNVYYICVNHKNHLYKFKFQCQKGYILNSTTIKCIETKEIESNESVSISNDNSSITDGTSGLTDSTSSSTITNNVSSKSKKSNEAEESPEKTEGKDDDDDDDDEVFKCKKEGKFPIRNECRRYYLCKKTRGQYRRKIKKCESGSVFHKNKKKCVDADSYEC